MSCSKPALLKVRKHCRDHWDSSGPFMYTSLKAHGGEYRTGARLTLGCPALGCQRRKPQSQGSPGRGGARS